MGREAHLRRQRREARANLAEAAAQTAQRRRQLAIDGAAEGARRGCLFCRRTDASFTSEEHVFPESLGNKEVVLPIGVVCDACNNGPLSQLDFALCDFGPIAMARSLYGIESKKGARPSFAFDNGTIGSDRPGVVQLALSSSRWIKPVPSNNPAHQAFSFTGQRRDATPKRLAKLHRALVKIAVECAWIDHGATRLLSAEFDRERSIVLDGGHHGYIVFPKQGAPYDPGARLTYWPMVRDSDGQPYLGIWSRILGWDFVTDTLQAEPAEPVPSDIAFVHRF